MLKLRRARWSNPWFVLFSVFFLLLVVSNFYAQRPAGDVPADIDRVLAQPSTETELCQCRSGQPDLPGDAATPKQGSSVMVDESREFAEPRQPEHQPEQQAEEGKRLANRPAPQRGRPPRHSDPSVCIGAPKRDDVSLTVQGWFGNWLFQVFATIAIAECNKAQAHFAFDRPVHNEYLAVVDKSLFPSATFGPIVRGEFREERSWGAFDRDLLTFSPTSKQVLLKGYLQSHRYFENIRDRVSESLAGFRAKTLADFAGPAEIHETPQECRIALHIRRGDMLKLQHLYWVPSADWIRLAVKLMLDRIQCENPLFIVACGGPDAGADDECTNWLRNELRLPNRMVRVSADPYRTFALLGSAEHAIVPVGTYSWWIGYQVPGEVITCPDFFSDRSTYSIDDYVPGYWHRLYKDLTYEPPKL